MEVLQGVVRGNLLAFELALLNVPAVVCVKLCMGTLKRFKFTFFLLTLVVRFIYVWNR